MQPGDAVLMTSCTITSTCKRGSKDKATMSFKANPNTGMVFLYLGGVKVEDEHRLREPGGVEALFKALGYIPDPSLTQEG